MDTIQESKHYKTGSEFIKNTSLEERKRKSSELRNKFSDKVPVIVFLDKSAQDEGIKLDKYKFLVQNTNKIGEFIFVLRNKIKVKETKAIFLFVNDSIPNQITTIGTLDKNNKGEDGFLKLVLSVENTFG